MVDGDDTAFIASTRLEFRLISLAFSNEAVISVLFDFEPIYEAK